MQPMRSLELIAALLCLCFANCAEANEFDPEVGKSFRIVRIAESESKRGDGGSGTTYDRDTLMERVISVRDDGLELEYDIPPSAKGEERAGNWQFPARVFKPLSGPTQLLNTTELETRLGSWLTKAGWDLSVCGKWIFTWNAFHIDCEPLSVLKMIAAFDLRLESLRAGAPYRDDAASAPAPLVQLAHSSDGSKLVAKLEVDPEFVRRAAAEVDVVVAEIYGRTLSLEDAQLQHAADKVSGTMVVTFETDASGQVKLRKTVTTIETVDRKGQKETRKTTETVERQRVY